MTRDLRYAARTLFRNKLFTAMATLALGLAMGANAAIFGLIDGLWFRPPGVQDPGRLVRVFATTQTEADAIWSFPEYASLRDHVPAFEGVVARGRRGALLAIPDRSPELVLVNVVSTNFFTVLGVRALHGRVFTDDDVRNAEATVVLGYSFWHSRFGGDPSIVGRTIPIGRSGTLPVTVLGVLPPEFRDLEPAADRDLWLPPFSWRQLSNGEEFQDRASRWFDVVARLRPGASLETARAQVSALAASFARDFPDINAGRSARVITELKLRLDTGGATAGALLALVLLVVLITCVNIANLLLARAEGRSGELAIRAAIGASRWRVARQLMAECALLGLLGATAGLTIGAWLIRLLPAIMAAPPGFRSFLVFQTDWRVVGFTAATTLVTTLLFGIAPSWLSTSAPAASLLKSGPGLVASGSSRTLLRHTLLTAQIAVSLVLLCAAGVLVRSFVATERADIGFERAPLLTAWASRDAPIATAREAVSRLEALPGVEQAAVAIRAPLSLSGGGMARPVFLPHAPADRAVGLPSIKFNAVSSNYFDVYGTQLLRGRAFNEEDQRAGTAAIVVNQQFAQQFLHGRDPLNFVVRIGGERGIDHRIVGVVRNAVINTIGETPEPYFYLPYWAGDYGEITYILRTETEPGTLSLPVRDALRGLDSRLEPRRVVTMREYIEHSSRVYQTTAILASALGGIGLLLTALGVYGVVAYWMLKRAREFAIRVAIGAAPWQLLSMTAREGFRLLVAGVALGIPAALLTTRHMVSMLFRVPPSDALSFLCASGLLCLIVGIATLIPAWRASRVNPSAVLRG